MNEIERLETEAGEAGDLEMAAICQIALEGEVSPGTWRVLDAEEREQVTRYNRESATAYIEAFIAECEAENAT